MPALITPCQTTHYLFLFLPCVSCRNGERGRLRRLPDLRNGLRAFYPHGDHHHPLPHAYEHAKDASHTSCTEALQIPPQETGNRK